MLPLCFMLLLLNFGNYCIIFSLKAFLPFSLFINFEMISLNTCLSEIIIVSLNLIKKKKVVNENKVIKKWKKI